MIMSSDSDDSGMKPARVGTGKKDLQLQAISRNSTAPLKARRHLSRGKINSDGAPRNAPSNITREDYIGKQNAHNVGADVGDESGDNIEDCFGADAGESIDGDIEVGRGDVETILPSEDLHQPKARDDPILAGTEFAGDLWDEDRVDNSGAYSGTNSRKRHIPRQRGAEGKALHQKREVGDGKPNSLSGLLGNGFLKSPKTPLKRTARFRKPLQVSAFNLAGILGVICIVASIMFITESFFEESIAPIRVDGIIEEHEAYQIFTDGIYTPREYQQRLFAKYGMSIRDDNMYLALRTWKNPFSSPDMGNRLLLMIDSDGNSNTGFMGPNLGIDHVIEIWGWDGSIKGRRLLHFNESRDKDDWNALQVAIGVSQEELIRIGTNSDIIMEIAVPLDSVGIEDVSKARFRWYFSDFLNYYCDLGDVIFSYNKASVGITQVHSNPPIIRENERIQMARFDLKNQYMPATIHKIELARAGTDTSINRILLFKDDNGNGIWDDYDGIRSRCDQVNGGFRCLFPTPLKIDGEDESLFVILESHEDLVPGGSFGLFIQSIDAVEADASVALNAARYNLSHVLSVSEYIVLDGACMDWDNPLLNTSLDRDRDREARNPNIDLTELGLLSNESALFLKVGVVSHFFSGQKLLVSTGFWNELPDSDLDTIPDPYDPWPLDFNNDHIPDESDASDRDGDGIMDYPYGTDLFLNTTLPSNKSLLFWYFGKEVRTYIGPKISDHNYDLDRDGLDDSIDEYPLDFDNDGITSKSDPDDDNDGIPEIPYIDLDGDGIVDFPDGTDMCKDGNLTRWCPGISTSQPVLQGIESLYIYLDLDRNRKTGKAFGMANGVDAILTISGYNGLVESANIMLNPGGSAKNADDWAVVGNVSFYLNQNQLELMVPWDELGISGEVAVDVWFHMNDWRGDFDDWYAWHLTSKPSFV